MIAVYVVDESGVSKAVGRAVILMDAATKVPIVVARQWGGTIEILTVKDGDEFGRAVRESAFPAQLDVALANRVVTKTV